MEETLLCGSGTVETDFGGKIQIFQEPQANFTWCITENFFVKSYCKKTFLNRLKWYLATRLFLPGTHKWEITP